jgi:hypothetical protein
MSADRAQPNHLHNSLREQARAAAGRDRDPSAAIID